MSWVDQCKAIFKVHVDAEFHRYKFKFVGNNEKVRIINRLSKDVGIPAIALKRWYYEATTKKKFPLCKKCNKEYVAIGSLSLDPHKNGKAAGLCSGCRKSIAVANV